MCAFEGWICWAPRSRELEVGEMDEKAQGKRYEQGENGGKEGRVRVSELIRCRMPFETTVKEGG